MPLASSGLLSLSRDECRTLLSAERVGRVVLSVNAMPAALPVAYRVVGDDVVFRTSAGGKLSAALNRTVVAFEVDHIDAEAHSGWSVLVVGESRVVDDDAEIARLDGLGIDTWLLEPTTHYVGIRIGRLSGRRLLSGDASPEPHADPF